MQDATVQSIPQMSPAQPAVAPSSYVTPAAPAPSSYQAAPVAYQVGTAYPQAIPQANISYQSAPTQYAPQSQPAEAPQGNPWESAFNKVVNLLSAPVQSPFQGQQSAPTTYTPANYGQAKSPATWNSAAPTSLTSPASSPNYSQTSSSPSLADVADYLGLSQESRVVIDAYGVEAPALLNQYALQLEGMLDSAVAWGHRAQDLIGGYANYAVTAHNLLAGYADFAVAEHTENLAYNEILTNPDVLSDYTLKFFGPEGPYPVYENEAQLETRGYPTAPVQANYGEFPAPPAASAPQQPENFWGSFKQQMDTSPENAWRLLNYAQPNVVANKLFVME
jgi:hypothetical protein